MPEDPFPPAAGVLLRCLRTFPHPKGTQNAAVFDFFFPLLYIIHLFRRIGSRSWAKNAFKGVFGFSGRFGFPARPFCTENAANSGCLRPKSANSLFGGLSERSSVRRPVPGQNRPRFPMQKARKYRHAPIRRTAAMEGSGPGGAGGRDATVQGVDS